jgi:hypothetical protein
MMLTKAQAAQTALQCLITGTAFPIVAKNSLNKSNEFRRGILPIWDSLHNLGIYRRISRSLLGQLNGGRGAEDIYT